MLISVFGGKKKKKVNRHNQYTNTDDDDTFPDPNDRATLESDRNFVLRIRDRERKLKSKVEKALERLENGTFGICEECSGEISEGRLKARPVTTLCIQCKEEQEKQEKARQTK